MSALVLVLLVVLSVFSAALLLVTFLVLKKKNLLPWQNSSKASSVAGNDVVKKLEAQLSTDAADTLAYVSTSASWTRKELDNWTNGFMTGCWWKMYDLTKKDSWKKLAEQGCKKLAPWQHRTTTHDIGFVIMCSYGNAPTPDARVLKTAAGNLAKRFMRDVGMFRSWKDMGKPDPEVIIDNMMNLRLMFEASKLPGGDPKWKDMAIKHATKSASMHVRANGSTFHKVTFVGGKPKKGTHQGAGDNTTWSRGQAWAMYGFTEVYEYTQTALFKDTAIKCCNYFIDNLPSDNIPLWDFQAPANKQNKDTSAAAIGACALFRLGKAVGDSKYTAKAKAIVDTLSTAYQGSAKGLASLLCCGVGNLPKNLDVNVGYIVGDYYYLEALTLM